MRRTGHGFPGNLVEKMKWAIAYWKFSFKMTLKGEIK